MKFIAKPQNYVAMMKILGAYLKLTMFPQNVYLNKLVLYI